MTVLGVLLCAALMALGAQVSAPMVPVPMTLQSLAVVFAGGWLGARWGVAAVMLYLAAAAMGLPVLSDGSGGLDAFAGPTAGYLVGFLLAAWIAGAARRRGWLVCPAPGIAALIAAHLFLLAAGVAWLAHPMGLERALAVGFTPFLVGAMVKSAVAWLAIWILDRRADR